MKTLGQETRLRARSVRPAVLSEAAIADATDPHAADPNPRTTFRVLIVDLNNFTSFPTLAIGLLSAALRNRGHSVDMISPLSFGVPAVVRERRETLLDHVLRRVHLSDWAPVLGLRDRLRRLRRGRSARPHPSVLRTTVAALEHAGHRRPDVVLLSAYLQHHRIVRAIAGLAQARGIPVLLGGPMFNLTDVAQAWRDVPGLTAIVGAEADRDVPGIVETLCRGGDLLAHAGVVLPDGRRSVPAAPLRNLDDTPVPDFADFPWDRYPVRIVPVMTGRGCQWDKCLFCSDVISASGRTFRTRSVENVLSELREQARRHGTSNFLFLDLKLNSWPGMIRGIARGLERHVPGAQWVGTVHVDGRADNGLSRADLDAAVAGGMRRISFGLESGSQRLLDAMRKGSTVEGNSRFIRDAHAAGLSIRCTMFKGFPGETAEDMDRTAEFLAEHAPFLDRVRFNDFSLQTGTPIWRAMQEKSDGALSIVARHDREAHATYRHRDVRSRAYRAAKGRALGVVYAINSRPLRNAARQFDGLM